MKNLPVTLCAIHQDWTFDWTSGCIIGPTYARASLAAHTLHCRAKRDLLASDKAAGEPDAHRLYSSGPYTPRHTITSSKNQDHGTQDL